MDYPVLANKLEPVIDQPNVYRLDFQQSLNPRFELGDMDSEYFVFGIDQTDESSVILYDQNNVGADINFFISPGTPGVDLSGSAQRSTPLFTIEYTGELLYTL